MNNNKALLILFGIALTLLSLVFYLGSKPPLNLFFITIGILTIIFGFYSENKKIKVTKGYIVAVFSVNIAQWLILIYVFYYNPIFNRGEYLIDLIAALWVTLFLANQIRKKYIKSSQTKIDILKEKTKLILLIIGIIITIGSLTGLITYYAPVFLYGITLGLMVFVYGFYHEKRVNVPEKRNIAHMYLKKDNMAINYIKVMGFLLLLQFFILIYFFRQISIDDWANTMTLSMNIAIFFSIQIYLSDLKLSNGENGSDPKISNKKKEMIVGISAIILFIVIFGAFYQIGYTQSNVTEDEDILNSYSVIDTSYNINPNISTQSFSDSRFSFNYPEGWFIYSQGNMVIITKGLDNKEVESQIEIKPNNGMSEEDAIKQSQGSFMSGKPDASYKLTIDNKTAYEDIYTYEDDKLMKFAQIILVKNDKTYLMYLQAPDEEFDKEKSNFAVILNSFKVQ